ncbi:MAG: hypothetical protein N2379_02720 [Verrucomicrobiae bacterium]|nr:hypothetical protein [Verrucomicrobiae bacterium]
MNTGNDKELEAAIDRLLKTLPPLRAPDTLVPRVLAAVTPQARLAWYRRPWQTWPVALQLGSLAAALALCAGVYIGIGELVHALRGTFLATQLDSLLGALSAVHQAAQALAHVGGLVAQRIGTGWLVGCGLIALLSYAACVGLATIFARLAWAQNTQNHNEP